MGMGAATWAAIVAAWYDGDEAAARAEIYQGRNWRNATH